MRWWSAFAALFLIAATGWSQDTKERSTAPKELNPRGFEIFRGVLDLNGIKPLTIGMRAPPPGETWVIVLGPHFSTQNYSLAQMVLPTSHILYASRGPLKVTPNFTTLKFEITDSEFELPKNNDSLTPAAAGEQRQRFPFLKPRVDLMELEGQPSIEYSPFKGFNKIATDRPSTILQSPERLDDYPRAAVAFLPPRSVDRKNPNRIFETDKEPFAVGNQIHNGRGNMFETLVMADDSVFNNQMMAMEGTDNLPFAMKLSKRMSEQGVKYCLFFENGDLVEKFDDVKFQLSPITPPIPIPPPQIIDQIGTQIANQAIDQIDRSNFLNNFWTDRPMWLGRLIATLLGILIISGLWIVFRTVWSRRHQPSLVSMPMHPFAKLKIASGLVGQLQRDVIISGDYGPVVRDYLKELFQACGLKSLDQSVEKPMPIKYDGRSNNAMTLARDLAFLWEWTFNESKRIRIADWKMIEPIAIKLWKSAKAGRWRFVYDNATSSLPKVNG